MVLDSTDVQVWFTTQSRADQVLIVPYARSKRPLAATYSLRVSKSGQSGNSRISQRGSVDLTPSQAQVVSQLRLDLRKGDDCRVELSLSEGGSVLGNYTFRCGD